MFKNSCLQYHGSVPFDNVACQSLWSHDFINIVNCAEVWMELELLSGSYHHHGNDRPNHMILYFQLFVLHVL